MEHDETGCQAREGPILCANNCGFFGSAATMNLCSKCHEKHVLEQEQVKLAAASIDSIVNDAGSSGGKHVVIESANVDVASSLVEAKTILTKPSDAPAMSKEVDVKAKEGPNRCNTCRKRVGLTGFNCRCGNVFCGEHRYHNKHNCPFDYKTAARDAIAKANPLIKPEKLDKI